MKKFHLEIDVISDYCDNCNFLDDKKCEHPDAPTANRVSNGFDVMMAIPDWCPLPEYTEQVESIINMAVTFGRKND